MSLLEDSYSDMKSTTLHIPSLGPVLFIQSPRAKHLSITVKPDQNIRVTIPKGKSLINFWSYVEDAELWDLPKDREWRALLPDWQETVLFLGGMLDKDKVKKLVDVVSKNYFKAEQKLNGKDYNPFINNFFFSIKLIGYSKNNEKLEDEGIINHLITKKEFLCHHCNYYRKELYDIKRLVIELLPVVQTNFGFL